VSRIVAFLSYIGHPLPAGALSGHASKMLCPFHGDTNPSAKVFPETDTIHCFACNKTWTVETAWMQWFGVTFSEAVSDTRNLFPGGSGDFVYRADPSMLRRYSELDGAAVNEFAGYLKSKILRNRYPAVVLDQYNVIMNSNLSLSDLFATLLTFDRSLSDASF